MPERGTQPTVLVVEDNSDMRSFIVSALGKEYRVVTARNGKEALEMAQAERPELILSDIMMPVMDGLSAAQQITARPQAPAVVMLTTFDLDEYVFQALQAGATGFLLKDTPPREIAAAVRAVADGTATLSPAVTATLIDSYVERRAAPRRAAALERVAALSEREREVLRLLGHNMPPMEEAAE